ncbi:hypothetical protein HDU96_004753 [Phlyctochytrium bullatum]|nr:hypothetical protein HDU96_004753 [Phlyctochytrium bullatum]
MKDVSMNVTLCVVTRLAVTSGDDRRHGSRHSRGHDDDVDRMQEDQGDDGGWSRREARGCKASGGLCTDREDHAGDHPYYHDDKDNVAVTKHGGSCCSWRRDDDYDRRGISRRDDHDDYGPENFVVKITLTGTEPVIEIADLDAS